MSVEIILDCVLFAMLLGIGAYLLIDGRRAWHPMVGDAAAGWGREMKGKNIFAGGLTNPTAWDKMAATRAGDARDPPDAPDRAARLDGDRDGAVRRRPPRGDAR